MSTTGMINLQNAPRDVKNLLQIKRGIRYRLGLQIHIFKDSTEEQAFLSASDQDQAELLAAGLQQYDANGQGNPAAPAASTALPQQLSQPTMPQTTAPAMPPQAASTQAPLNMQVVGSQPVMPPAQPQAPTMPQQRQQLPLPLPPPQSQPQMPTMPVAPQMPAQPVATPSPQPVAPPPQPQQLAAPVPPPQPVTNSDPNNTGGTLGTSIPQKIAGILKALKQIAEVGESNQAWIEEVHDHALGNSRVLSTLLLLQLVMVEQQGFDTNMLVKLMLNKTPDTVENFLQNFATEEDDEGKG